MPNNVYFWSHKERAQHNTERHQVFAKELYPLAKLSGKAFQDALLEFKEKNFDLLDSEKSAISGGVRTTTERGASDSKLNNKLEG